MTSKFLCPFGNPLPKRRKFYAVPAHCRRRLAAIAELRRTLNNDHPIVAGEYYARSKTIEREWSTLLSKLRGYAGLTSDHIIELHDGWLFSGKRSGQYLRSRAAKKHEESKLQGPTDIYLKKWPDPQWDPLAIYRQRSWDRYVLQTHKKKK